MNKIEKIKFFSVILLILFISVIFSGCIKDDETLSSVKQIKDESFIEINAPKKAFFNEDINFNIEKNEDIDYDILSYTWNFQDGKKLNGQSVSYNYDFSKDMEIEYPLVYTITLCTLCSDKSIRTTEHRIKLYPKEFVLFLDENSLEKNIPESRKDKISNEILETNQENEKIYSLENAIYLDKCKWEGKLFIKKPLLCKIKDVKIILFNQDNIKISEGQLNKDVSLFDVNSCLVIRGEISEKVLFKKAKIVIESSSFLFDLKIQYGGVNPSQLVFNFVK